MNSYLEPTSGRSGSNVITLLLHGLGAILAVKLIILLVKNRRKIYCTLIMLPRDFRGAWRYFNTIRFISEAEKKGMNIARIFDAYAEKKPDKVCFYFEDQEWTYHQVQELSNRIGNYFAQKGYKKGDVVALFLESRPEFVCLWLGLNKIGVLTAWINHNLRMEPLQHCIKTVKSKAVIFGYELSPAIKDIVETNKDEFSKIALFCTGSKENSLFNMNGATCATATDLDLEIKSVPTNSPPNLGRSTVSDGLCYTFTSGTTGLPKGVLMKQHRFMMMGVGLHNMNQIREDDIMYNSLPLYHVTGGIGGIGQAILCGTSVVIRKKFSASEFWSDCIKYNVTVALYLGELLRYLLAQPPSPKEKMHKLRLICGNGLRAKIWQEVMDRFNIPAIGEVYGSTEGNCSMSNIDSKVGAVGFVPVFLQPILPMMLAKIDEETGEFVRDPKTGLIVRCNVNEPGELVGKIIKSNPIRDFHGYTDAKATNTKILRSVFTPNDSAFRSGDILIRDEFGYFYFKDRTGDTYRWKGENVSTTEVETIISSCCSFKDSVVYGVEVPNTEGKAGMVAISDPEGSIVISHNLEKLAGGMCKSLPAYARPLFLRVLTEMDVTGTFKMKKTRLQNEGYDISRVKDPIYFFHGGKFVSLDKELFEKINLGKIRL